MSEEGSFSQKGRNAVKWSLYDKFLKRGMAFVVSMFLARLLEPADFGLVAMVGFFTAFASSFADMGIGQVLVQKKHVNRVQYSTVFYINILIGILIFTSLWISAPYISRFYDQNIITRLVRYSSFSFIIGSLTIVNTSLLRKELKYKSFAIVSFLSSLGSGLIGITMAYYGYGVWSLVISGLAGSFISMVMYWFMVDWRPDPVFDFSSIKDIWKNALGFFNIGIINSIMERVDNLIIGKLFNAASLGFYNRARALQELPLYTFILPVTRPFFPMFATMQDDPARQRKLFYNTVEMLNFIIILGFGLMFVLADNLIVLLYSDKWIESIPYFKILIFLIPLAPFNTLSTSLFKGTGKLKLLTFITVIDRGSVLFALIFGIKYGLLEYLYAFVGFKVFVSLFRVFFVQKYLDISAKVILGSIMKMLIILTVISLPVELFLSFGNIYTETVVKALLIVSGFVLISYVFNVKGFNLLKAEAFSYLKINK